MQTKKIGFIGAGNIAEAMIRGLIASTNYDPGDIIISDSRDDRTVELNSVLGATVACSNIDLVERSSIIFISVKPNLVDSVLLEIKGALSFDKVLVSLAAGKSLDSIKDQIDGHQLSVRIMPNLAAKVRRSTISLYAKDDFPLTKMREIESTLSSLGKVFKISDEKLMPSITALSGSAPAYYVMMASALIEFGVSEGMDRDLATRMILQTMEGSAAWAESSKIPLSTLWKQVVTPGGTTEAGIEYFNSKGFIDTFVEGLRLATKRAKEMGDS